MILTKDSTFSPWQKLSPLRFPPLSTEIQTDVCIVGGGIAGLTTAYCLSQNGFLNITVIDDGEIGGRQTLRTTAHLSNAFDDRYFQVQKHHGLETSQLVADSHTAAIEKVQEIIQTEKIDCDFSRLDGYLFLDPHHKYSFLEEEHESCVKAGLKNAELLSHYSVGILDLGPCLRFRDQAQLHAGKYMLGLVEILTQRGVKIYSHTRANDVHGGKNSFVMTNDGYKINASHIVVATNVPFNSLLQIHLKQTPHRTYVLGFKIAKGAYPNILLWDTGSPYHYIRRCELDGEEIVLVGGEDHKTGQGDHADMIYGRLEHWARIRFPFLHEIAYRWSGQVIEPADYLAYIGSLGEGMKNIYMVTGDSGQGITHGTIAGMLISDLVFGKKNPWEKIYDPHRISAWSAPTVVRENFNNAVQYAKWMSPGEVSSESLIEKGTGAIVRRGMSKIAVYRDDLGFLHEKSAVCPHL